MCGIAGYVDFGLHHTMEHMQEVVGRMTDAIIKRGPDEGAIWCDPCTGIALGHRRLSIVDLTPSGSQPMHSNGDRYCLVFNGEIYNFRELRKELEQEGHKFRGTSDTEVILNSIINWGLPGALERIVGMFAFALWDKRERVLYLVRDRVGEKPLYYGWGHQCFYFASELKALKQHPEFHGTINRDALAAYLRHNYIPGPYSIYEGVSKLEPGTFLRIDCVNRHTQPVPYWTLQDVVTDGKKNIYSGSDEDARRALKCLLVRSVREQMLASDVPIGAFLSGGIDSSTVVAIMQSQSSVPIKTFSIGFTEDNYNEAIYANRIANYLGTEHTELYVTPAEAMGVIPDLPQIYDEPFSDSSQIPTFLVARLARQSVTVTLSGDGGDELFGGYNRYTWAKDIWTKIGWIPYQQRALLTSLLRSGSPNKWSRVFEVVNRTLPPNVRQKNAGDKIHKIADLLSARGPQDVYRKLISHWDEPTSVVIGSREPETKLTSFQPGLHKDSFLNEMMYLDTLTYLPDDILVKVDRASMAVSLEARVPFLDHRVLEFAWQLPLQMKVRNRVGKWLLRQLLYEYVPKKLVDRPKMGFAVPIGDWLRTSLREWAEELLNEHRLKQEGFFNSEHVTRIWREHINGTHNNQGRLWDILMFQAWLQAQK